MAKDLTDYQAQVGRVQGADYFYFKAEDGGGMAFFEEMDVTADQIMMGIVAATTVNSVMSAAAGGFCVSVFPVPYGTYLMAASTGQSVASVMKLPVARKGATLRLDFGGFVGDANLSLWAQSAGGLDGCSLETLLQSNVSTIMGSASGVLILVAKADGLWAIIDATGQTVQAAS